MLVTQEYNARAIECKMKESIWGGSGGVIA